MATRTVELDLLPFRGANSTVFTGRPQGEDARRKLNLDRLDKDDVCVFLRVPTDTTTITPSFFLGLLFESIRKISFPSYQSKYFFKFRDMDAERIEVLTKDIAEGERNALNTVSGKRGLDFLLNTNK